ncbi:TPA: hypothetical protein ACKOH0_000266 [Clostridioides difficile]
MNNKKYYPTAIALYFSYFLLGIGISILGQYKPEFSSMWGAKTLSDGTLDVSIVLAVIAALGLGSSLRTVVARSSIILLGAFNAVN